MLSHEYTNHIPHNTDDYSIKRVHQSARDETFRAEYNGTIVKFQVSRARQVDWISVGFKWERQYFIKADKNTEMALAMYDKYKKPELDSAQAKLAEVEKFQDMPEAFVGGIDKLQFKVVKKSTAGAQLLIRTGGLLSRLERGVVHMVPKGGLIKILNEDKTRGIILELGPNPNGGMSWSGFIFDQLQPGIPKRSAHTKLYMDSPDFVSTFNRLQVNINRQKATLLGEMLMAKIRSFL